MSEQRRYDEDEVARIFEAATSEHAHRARAVTSGDGLTLEELKSIGEEVGLEPERIAAAAAAQDLRRSVPARRTVLGVPLSVGRVVELPRAPDDREWELLVAELRQTFGARGKLSSHGTLREWTNGNLHAFVEPTEHGGFRLRMGTLKESAVQFGQGSLGLLGIALVLGVLMVVTGRIADAFFAPLFLAMLGVGGLGVTALGLPSWARQREAQMEHVGARAIELLGAGSRAGADQAHEPPAVGEPEDAEP